MQDPFKYSYPPLVDDDFQTPLCENGPIASEDETSSKEDIEGDGKETLETISNEEPPALSEKVILGTKYNGIKSCQLKLGTQLVGTVLAQHI